jgi:MoaA/NifB/PqqE/SkfB family radical SAM enzyme
MKLFNFVDYQDLVQCGDLTKRSRLFTGYACNIRCKFCFYRNEKHIDIQDLIYQQLYWGEKYGITDWDISGGEPSILPYWFEILYRMKKMGFRNIACITNGYKFSDPEFLLESKELGMNELLFSIHGSTEEMHDAMTGVDGSYVKMHTALVNARYYGMKIRINVVVTKDNYKDLLNIAKKVMPFRPIAFNFLPFRIENSADKDNAVRYSDIAPYIKETIDFIDDRCKVAIRYVPFCLFEGYEIYVAGYLQRVFDEYEWNEYTIRKFENARFGKDIEPLDLETNKWILEKKSLQGSIKHVANHSTKCLRCRYLYVCDGIWKSYANIWGIDEFKPIEGEKTKCII